MHLACIICSDIFTSSHEIQANLCGHMFHKLCIFRWIDRSPTCPQCRSECTRNTVHRIFFNAAMGHFDPEIVQLQLVLNKKIEAAELKANEKEIELQKSNNELTDLKHVHIAAMKKISELEKDVKETTFTLKETTLNLNVLKNKVKTFEDDRAIIERQRQEIAYLKAQLDLLKTIQSLISSTASEVDSMMKQNNSTEMLTTCVAVLKRQLREFELKQTEIRNQLKDSQNVMRKLSDIHRIFQNEIAMLKSENTRMAALLPDSLNMITDSEDDNSDVICLGTPEKENLAPKDNQIVKKNLKRVNSDASRYLTVRSKSIGLVPLIKRMPLEDLGCVANYRNSVTRNSNQCSNSGQEKSIPPAAKQLYKTSKFRCFIPIAASKFPFRKQ